MSMGRDGRAARRAAAAGGTRKPLAAKGSMPEAVDGDDGDDGDGEGDDGDERDGDGVAEGAPASLQTVSPRTTCTSSETTLSEEGGG